MSVNASEWVNSDESTIFTDHDFKYIPFRIGPIEVSKDPLDPYICLLIKDEKIY